jgi:general secretion pathway protein J
MAYGGLSNILTSDKVLTEREAKLKDLQRTMMFLERDIRQMVARPRRSGYDQVSQALSYGLDSDGLLEFTRAGNSNPTGMARSSLQRVRYDLEEKKLTRKSWSLVDYIDAEPIEMELLENVELLELRLLDSQNQWQTNWNQEKTIPKAIEITLVHKDWGKIVRLIPVK